MALEPIQPLTKINTRNLHEDKGRSARDKLTAICEPIVKTKCGNLDVSNLYGTPGPVTGVIEYKRY
jgi:hypothetical protein